MLDQELDVADQVGQTKLHEHAAVLHVLAVGAEVVAAQKTVEFLAQHGDEHVGTARRIDAEQREEGSAEAPGPQPVPLVGVPGLVDVEARFAGQDGQHFLVGLLQAGADLGHQLGQIPAADRDADHVAQVLTDGGKRAMTGALEEPDQGREFRTSQAGLLDRLGQGPVMHPLAVPAPIGQSTVLLDAHGLVADLDLLDQPRSGGGVLKLATAIGALRQRVVLGLVDLLGRKLRALMLRMAGLTAAAAFLVLALRIVLGRLDDITGRRLGGIAGMLSRRGQLRFERSHPLLEFAASRTIWSSHADYARKSAAAQLRQFLRIP